MLRRLLIRDFVIVDRLELEFEGGFGALTGETGAGKSILLDALGLTLGGRAEAGLVRVGKERADVTAEFDVPPGPELAAWLADQAVPDEGGLLLVRRTVEAGGRSRAWINGMAATLNQLRELGEWLVDIHGQHAHHALVREETQRQLLDAQAGTMDLAAEVGGLFRRWQKARQALAGAEQDNAASAREREILTWQVAELEALDFEPEAWRELNAEHARLAHGASLLSGSDEVLAALGEGDFALAPQLDRLVGRLAGLAEFDARLGDIRELLSAAAISAGEALHELRRYRDRLEIDPGRLAEVEQRIGTVTDMARKHRVAPEDLPDLLARLGARLAELARLADPEALAREAALAESAYRSAAGRLSALRVPAARALSEAVSAAMQTLAMAGGCFEATLVPVEEGTVAGQERVDFQVAANPHQPLRSLGKVASGGELSRIGLAIQVITSRNAATPTLIFDEVDVGIGGGVAEIVGKLLRQLGCERQVLCVTHLPQVAAQAHWQWSIAKIRRGEETVSQVAALDRAGRIEEIARMLGGVTITGTTRHHAAEMLGFEAG